jgi:nucleoside-diphosphate-sugar epimerase
MIVGSGLIANAFSSRSLPDDVLLFASGVSNSKEKRPEPFERELNLIRQTADANPERRIIYFSTASVMDPELSEEPYVIHKLKCEEWLKNNTVSPLILRVTNVVGNSGNPATVFNFFKHCIQQDIRFSMWTQACRNFIDIEDLVSITMRLIHTNGFGRTWTLANPESYPVMAIVKKIEDALGKKAVYDEVELGTCFNPLSNETLRFYADNDIRFDESYLDLLISKYL